MFAAGFGFGVGYMCIVLKKYKLASLNIIFGLFNLACHFI